MIKSLALSLICIQVLTFSFLYAQPIGLGFVDESSDYLEGVYGNDNFVFVDGFEEVTVSMHKSPWDGLTFELAEKEADINPIISFKLSTPKPISIRVDFLDRNLQPIEELTSTRNVQTGNFQEVLIPLDQNQQVISPNQEPDQIATEYPSIAIIYIEPGKRFAGDIKMRDFYMGPSDLQASSLIQGELDVFPNPASEGFNIGFPHDSFSEILVYDITGRVQIQRSIQARREEAYYLDISKLSTGIYYLSAKSKDQVLTTKVVVK